MKNSDIFVAVISEPSFMSKSPIFGKPIGEYLADEIAAFPHAVFDCEKRVTRPKCKFFCLLYADMALVTLLAFLPTLLLSVPAGVLADRYDRRLLMMLQKVAQMEV